MTVCFKHLSIDQAPAQPLILENTRFKYSTVDLADTGEYEKTMLYCKDDLYSFIAENSSYSQELLYSDKLNDHLLGTFCITFLLLKQDFFLML